MKKNIYLCVYIYIYIYITESFYHFAIHQKLKQQCKSTIFQFFKNVRRKKLYSRKQVADWIWPLPAQSPSLRSACLRWRQSH